LTKWNATEGVPYRPVLVGNALRGVPFVPRRRAVMTEPDYDLLARFLQEYEQASDRPTVLGRWSRDFPGLAADLAALVEADQLLGQVRPGTEPVPPERLGDFRILRKIASGGMGVVYEAVQEPFGRRVAVKTIRQPQLSEQARARFL